MPRRLERRRRTPLTARQSRMTLTVWSSSRYTFPLPEGHRFPVAKYAMLRERVIADNIVPLERVLDPPRAGEDALVIDNVRLGQTLGCAESGQISQNTSHPCILRVKHRSTKDRDASRPKNDEMQSLT